MTEATLKEKTVQQCRIVMPMCKTIKHQNMFGAGVPDVSLTWHGRTSWWEFKVAWEGREPSYRNQQRMVCLELAGAGVCYYVIFTVSKTLKPDIILQTAIVHPRNVVKGTWPYEPVIRWPGICHREVAEFMRTKHP